PVRKGREKFMSRSNQFARTDRDICNALLSLMDEKPFEKITVGDIIEETMINRSTFYLHFQDKYAVLEKLESDYIGAFTVLIGKLRESSEGLGAIDQVIGTYFMDNRRNLRRLMRIEDFERQIKKLIGDYLKTILPRATAVESEMFTAMTVSFLLYIMEHPGTEKSFSTMFYGSYLHLATMFFRLDRIPDGEKRLSALVAEANQSAAGNRT
ncbi:MAG: TetR family transcriptional regulator, partial [Lachnospiraceae bacterium]